MKRKSTQTKGIKRKIALLLSIALLFTLAFTGTAFAENSDTDFVVSEEAFANYDTEYDAFVGIVPQWGHAFPRSHIQLIRGGNTSGISAAGVQLLEAGMVMPDGITRSGHRITCQSIRGSVCRNAQGEDNLKGLRAPEFRGFHGYHTSRQNGVFAESNYVAAYSLITMIANRGGETGNLPNPGLTGGTGGALFNVRNRFRRTEGVADAEGMRLTCSAGHSTYRTWQQIMDLHGMTGYRSQNATGQRSFRRHFIWGIALHALSDTFEHSALVTGVNSSIWRIVNRQNGNLNVHPGERFDAAQAAVNAGLRVVASGSNNNGCCCQFRAASGRFNGTHFRLANLTRYSNQNAIAVAHRGALNATERRQLRGGDMLMPVNINPVVDSETYSHRCSLCHVLVGPVLPCSC